MKIQLAIDRLESLIFIMIYSTAHAAVPGAGSLIGIILVDFKKAVWNLVLILFYFDHASKNFQLFE